MPTVLEAPGAPLPQLHLGAPSQVGPLTLFPVWTDAPLPKQPLPLLPPKAATIGELDTPTVELLHVTNPTQSPFVLLEGTVVDGGWQHRVLIHDVLVGAGRDTTIDVRCVEHGRWQGGSRQRLSKRRAPLAVSGALRGVGRSDVAYNAAPDRKADQSEVWERVAAYERTLSMPTPTGSMVDVFDNVRVPNELLGALPKPLLGQRGVLIGVDGHPALLEIFEHPRSLARQWKPLLESLLAATAHRRPVPTLGWRARAFVERLTARHLPFVDDAGDGFLAETADDLVSVRSLVGRDGKGIHAAALNVRHRLVLAA